LTSYATPLKVIHYGGSITQTLGGEISSRPKAQSLQQEDQFFNYEFDSRGGLKSKTSKDYLSQYEYWYNQNVKFEGNQRTTPLTEFEKQMGMRVAIPSYKYRWCIREGYGCRTQIFNEDEWRIFQQSHSIDAGNLEIIYKKDVPTDVGQGHKDWNTYFTTKARERDLIVVNLQNLEFREKQKPAVVEKVRSNPKVEKVEPVEIEPIKEAVKYSPLMIAGVIAVVVILLLKRRRA